MVMRLYETINRGDQAFANTYYQVFIKGACCYRRFALPFAMAASFWTLDFSHFGNCIDPIRSAYGNKLTTLPPDLFDHLGALTSL